ncbi:ComEC/Rec2 family competence protein [Occultella glacieicola]|uniref:ComEC/Rec2 family competence protein n=1 Tax=Occultella glacieicola TaxID=2518684 RepID=A0ABY2DZZ5_9MICO|nr:ComEC/Rec2 family competence protein [Occultella glacieicola]TDE89923.1 ComEC/Rec2 family competence protein [Occultella glacieicola]
MRTPLDLRLLPAAALAWAGSWLVLVVPPVAATAVVLGLLVCTLGCLHRLGRRHRARHRFTPRERVLAAVALGCLVGAAVLGLAAPRVAARAAAVAPVVGERGVATLVIGGEPQELPGWSGASLRVPATLVEANLPGGRYALAVPVTVIAGEGWENLPVGGRIRTDARFAATDAGDAAALLVIADGAGVSERAPPWWQARVGDLRAGLVAASAGLAPQARGLVPGITLGDVRALPVPLEEDLRTVALTHVTAVSGAHVAIILGTVLLAVWWAPRWLRVGIGAVVLVAFVALVYPSGSVLRAATMGGLMLLGLALRRPRAALPALWVAIVALLVADPWIARSYGFVLSAVATGGLLLWAGPLAGVLARYLPRPLALAVAVPIAAQAACAPIIVLLQPGVALYAVPANLLAAAAVPPATVLGVVATLTAPVSPVVAAVLAGWAGWCTAWIAAVATWAASLPSATVPWPGGLGGALLLAVLTGLVLTAAIRRLRGGSGARAP